MPRNEMARLASNVGLAKIDTEWWPTWMEAYVRSAHQVDAPRIDISRERLISLLLRMRDFNTHLGRKCHVRPVFGHAQTVGCDKQRAGTLNCRHGVPALALVTPYKSANWPAGSSVPPEICNVAFVV